VKRPFWQRKYQSARGREYILMSTFVQDWAMLQRDNHSAARLQLDREKLDLARRQIEQTKEKKLRDVKAPMSDEDRRAIVAKIDEIMGIPPGTK